MSVLRASFCARKKWPPDKVSAIRQSLIHQADDGCSNQRGSRKMGKSHSSLVASRRRLLQAGAGLVGGGLMPAALVQTAGNDVLRDEGEEYARKLEAAGVDVIAVRYSGMIHDWGLLNPISQVPATRASLLQVAEEIKRRFPSQHREDDVVRNRLCLAGGVA